MPNKHIGAIWLLIGSWHALFALLATSASDWWTAFAFVLLASSELWLAWRYSRDRDAQPSAAPDPAHRA
jgi:hypothetical protein